MAFYSYHAYVPSGEHRLYTVICLPNKEGSFPTVLYRWPYVVDEETASDEALCEAKQALYRPWLEAGYAVVYQHCRGTGKSSGEFIPYICERQDGLALQEWVRQQSFYNGELFVTGRSYGSSVHYETMPFAPDIKGAVLEVQVCRRYSAAYRNGFFKIGLAGNWYVDMYKKRNRRYKAFTPESFHTLPMADFSRTVFGEEAEAFNALLMSPRAEDPAWDVDAPKWEALQNADIPILFTTGFYDIYTGGIFDQWRELSAATRAKGALLVQPYDHGATEEKLPLAFPNGRLSEAFGNHVLRWFEAVRGKEDYFLPRGKVTYYNLFENRWHSDDFTQPEQYVDLPLGEGERTYRYNPYNPASFKGGLSANFGGTAYQDPPNSRYDILSFFTQPFDRDYPVKGQISAQLRVRSDCEDTCFYMRLSLVTEQGDYGLRDDILSLAQVCPDYVPGTEATVTFTFDDHAFLIRAGQRLRIDISSSAFPLYIRHTNQKGHYALQNTAKTAENTVICDGSFIRLPTE